ncbi:MAG: molybdenum cofactor guanylyltransferase [Cyclobacteriaceae bacterium]|nr:molybdenum cofactor guanylyltransferase [Cyclobacteriaceae bacterium]
MASLNSKDNNLNGLVLVGGKSSRMGSDKAFLNYHGTPQIEHITTLLAKFCNKVYVSAKHKTDYPNYQVIEDVFPFESPLNGILSAFNHTPNQAWLVVACDMPFIDGRSIEHLLTHRKPNKLATCYKNKSEKPEPLFCVWETSCYPELVVFQQAGNFSPRSFLMSNDVQMIPSGNNKVLLNVNTLTEFNEIKGNNS